MIDENRNVYIKYRIKGFDQGKKEKFSMVKEKLLG